MTDDVERVKCSNCDRMVLTTTFKRTRGLCRPCYDLGIPSPLSREGESSPFTNDEHAKGTCLRDWMRLELLEDDCVRLCQDCNIHFYDFRGLSREEALALIEKHGEEFSGRVQRMQSITALRDEHAVSVRTCIGIYRHLLGVEDGDELASILGKPEPEVSQDQLLQLIERIVAMEFAYWRRPISVALYAECSEKRRFGEATQLWVFDDRGLEKIDESAHDEYRSKFDPRAEGIEVLPFDCHIDITRRRITWKYFDRGYGKLRLLMIELTPTQDRWEVHVIRDETSKAKPKSRGGKKKKKKSRASRRKRRDKSIAPVDAEVTFCTDAAALALFDPDVIGEQFEDDPDCWCSDYHLLPEVREGSISILSLGSDGVYKLRLTEGDLSPAEKSYAKEVVKGLGLKVISGRFAAGAAELLSTCEIAPGSEAGEETDFCVPARDGEYDLEAYSIAWHEAPDWHTEDGLVPEDAPADIVVVLRKRKGPFQAPESEPGFADVGDEWVFPDASRRLGPAEGMELITEVRKQRSELVLNPCGPGDYQPLLDDFTGLKWRNVIRIRVVEVDQENRCMTVDVIEKLNKKKMK
ncbi:DUF6386 family protein [Acidobacteriota bacterium]